MRRGSVARSKFRPILRAARAVHSGRPACSTSACRNSWRIVASSRCRAASVRRGCVPIHSPSVKAATQPGASVAVAKAGVEAKARTVIGVDAVSPERCAASARARAEREETRRPRASSDSSTKPSPAKLCQSRPVDSSAACAPGKYCARICAAVVVLRSHRRRALLAEPHAVAPSAPVKEKPVALPAHLKPGAGNAVPAQRLADGQPKLFGGNLGCIEFERDGAARFAAARDATSSASRDARARARPARR